uniref:Uncharacterized protein n=1 Tax=Candidatus Kentrum sp. TC TaxID=2126339 RepID=A0A450YXP7_9GAMM|nr:MAG: hypothetical protein BECKTC1821E_GA0114239_10622 [Candidatus Kentron sp. TC]
MSREEELRKAEERKAELERIRQKEKRKRIERARIAEHESEQRAIGNKLEKLGADSLAWFEVMPEHLIKVEQFLDQAEKDFEENAFVPFWTAMEKATSELGAFDNRIISIRDAFERYNNLAKEL